MMGTTATFTYALSEAPKSGSVKVRWCSHLTVLSTTSGISEQVRDTTNPVTYTLAAGATSIRGIITGQENSNVNRGKANLQILPANDLNGYKIRLALHLRLSGSEDTSLQLWKDVYKVDPRGQLVHKVGYPQVSAWSKTANTGYGADMNEDNQGWQTNGPCPPYDTVQDNYNGGTFRPYKLDFETLLKTHTLSVTNNWDDYLWRTGSGTETVNGQTVHTRYTHVQDDNTYHSNKSYWVNASNGTCAYTEYPEATPPPVIRSYIYLHEDTNYSEDGGESRVTVKGTQGCTGLAPGGTADFYQQITEITSNDRVWYLSVNGSATTNIPYYVLNSDEVFNPTEYIYAEYPTENVGCFSFDGERWIVW